VPRLVLAVAGKQSRRKCFVITNQSPDMPDVSPPLSLIILPAMPRTPGGKPDRDAVAALAELADEDIRDHR
jgi:hypothetical protein